MSKLMGHNWGCPICMKVFRRESETLAERDRARHELQWDAINHLATHIMDNSLNGTEKNE